MKRKLLLAATFVASALGMRAQTDVTSTYLTNADFSSMTGWTEYKAAQYVNIGSGLIGTFKPTGSTAATVDATHLDSEYCIGFQARWNTNYIAYQQTTKTLPTGHYELSYDVEDVNSSSVKINYDNLFYVEVGSTKHTDTSTEWMNAGKSSWTTHTISFDVESETTVKVSLGYGNKEDKNTTPIIYVSHLKLTYTDPQAAAKAAALEAAKYTLNGYIKKATALNGVLSDATLATAVETAQGVYDAADDYAEDYENTVSASTTLNTAISTSLSSATTVSLSNGDFNTTPNNTLNNDETTNYGGTLSTSTSNPDNTKDMSANTGDHAYLYDVTGWTQYSKFNSTASQGTTSEYGTAMPANGWSTNSTTIPATDMFGLSEGAALHLSAGWGDQARYQQTVANLPSGRYIFYYEVINQYSNTGLASNYIGVNGTSGDFYGTTNSFVYSGLNSIEQGVWKAQAFEFDVAKTANINFSVGVTTSNSGSGNGAKLWIDNVLVYRIGDVIVTDADAEAIIAEVEALDETVYNADTKSALATAKSTFEGSKTLDNYNALSAALIQANASVTTYTALNTAITNVEGWTTAAASVTDPIRTKYTNGTYSNETTAADIYAEYQAAEIAVLAAAEATDYTSAIINPSFETGDMTGWSAESRTDTGVKAQSNGTYSITSGDAVDGNYLFNSWGGTAENNVYQTIKNLPAGTYTLSALLAGFTGEELWLSAEVTEVGSDASRVTVTGDKTTGYTVNVVFALGKAADVVIKAYNTKGAEGSDASFIKVDNFRLTAGDITTDDYTALNNAIAAAEAKTLGFDEGEYAPYNNTSAIAALAAAKAVDQSVTMVKTTLDGIVSDLTGATWTANNAEVDAIFDGQFATTAANATSGDINLPGWTKVQGIRLLVKDETVDPGLAYTEGRAAVFSWGGTTLTYGEQTGYTLPLNKHSIYKLTFKASAWRDGTWPSWVSVDLDGVAQSGATSVPGKINDAEGNPYRTYTYYLEPTADNSVLKIYMNQHFTLADLSLKLAVAEDLTISEAADYTPAETYADVTLTRTIKADVWNTFVVPFDLSNEELVAAFGETVAVAEYSETSADAENVTVSFNTMDTPAITANTPVLLKGAAGTSFGFSGKLIKTGEAKVAGNYIDFVGTYAATTDIAEGDYFIASSKLYKSTGSTTIAGTRAYLNVKDKENGAKVRMIIDDEATGIEGIAADAVQNGKVYDLSGRLVKNPTKGLYIQNGKKYFVK